VRLKFSNQGLIVPDQIFNQGHDRDEKIKIKVWLIRISFSVRIMIEMKKFESRSSLTKCDLSPAKKPTSGFG